MRASLAAVFVLALVVPVRAEVVSEYTDLDVQRDCVTIGKAEEGDGDWANFVCPGYKGYPVIVSYGDARESVFYGFPPDGEAGFVWESFSAFNSVGPKIEWRIDRTNGIDTPFATIHRWQVTDGDGGDEKLEVLVVEKVALLPKRESCAVGYVMATGNGDANAQARMIADEQARDFVCGDQPTVISGDRQMPDFARGAN